MKRVMFDVDGVLADFIWGFTGLASRMFPGVPITRTHEQPSWHGFPGMTAEQVDAVWRRVDGSPAFWYALNPLITPVEALVIKDLNEKHDLYFCTARRGVDAKVQTEAWLRRHGIENPTVVISKRKGEFCKAVQADLAIEDKAGNASFIDWQTDGRTKSYLLDRQYNQVPQEFLASGVKRVTTLSQFLEVI